MIEKLRQHTNTPLATTIADIYRKDDSRFNVRLERLLHLSPEDVDHSSYESRDEIDLFT